MVQDRENRGRWSAGDIVGLVGGVAGVIGGIIAVLSWLEAKESREIAADAQKLSQESFDRSTGKCTAKLTVDSFSPTVDEIPEQFKFSSFFGTEVVRFESLDQLIGLNPCLTVRNAGDEVIEALRVETKFVYGIIDGRDLPPEKQFAPTPWVLKQVEREDHELGRELKPGERAAIPIARGLVSQMLEAQAADRARKDHYGMFEIRCYARMVGVSSFDGADYPLVVMSFVWLPEGFTEDKCREFLDTFEPHVEVATGN